MTTPAAGSTSAGDLVEEAGDLLQPLVAQLQEIGALDRRVGSVGAEAPGEADVVAEPVRGADLAEAEVGGGGLDALDHLVDAGVAVAGHDRVAEGRVVGPERGDQRAALGAVPLVPGLEVALRDGGGIGGGVGHGRTSLDRLDIPGAPILVLPDRRRDYPRRRCAA